MTDIPDLSCCLVGKVPYNVSNTVFVMRSSYNRVMSFTRSNLVLTAIQSVKN